MTVIIECIWNTMGKQESEWSTEKVLINTACEEIRQNSHESNLFLCCHSSMLLS